MLDSTATAEQILGVPLLEPERLFPNDLVVANKVFREFAKNWHPDRNKHPKAGEVMMHLSALHNKVQDKIKTGTWAEPGTLVVASGGKVQKLRYVARYSFELGEIIIGKKLVSFVVDTKYNDHMMRGLRAIGSIRYPDNKWRTDMEPYFPKVEKLLTDKQNNTEVIVVLKDEDAILLSDLLNFVGGSLDPKHTAWVISSLLNLCCFLSMSGLSHNGLSTNTVFVSSKRHAAYILGGWWYAVPLGKTISAVPRGTYGLMTMRERTTKVASPRLDLECVREIGRVCIGTKLGSLPKPFANFLKMPASSSPVDDYEQWGRVLTDSFGARRFVKLDVSPSAVYGG